ncbi:MAG: VWA domain-containing protein [Pseudomonadota bacterium]
MHSDVVNIELGALAQQDQIGILLALHGHRLGGVVVMCQDDPVRAEQWLHRISGWRSIVGPPPTTIRTPVHCPLDQLLGGVDLIQTVLSGKTVVMKGLLERAHTGWLLLPMAEVQPSESLRVVCHALDQQSPTCTCAIAVSSAADVPELFCGDLAIDAALLDRMPFCLDLGSSGASTQYLLEDNPMAAALDSALSWASDHWSDVALDESLIAQLCEFAAALGITSIRAQLHCVMVARSAAALAGRDTANSNDLDIAMSLCFAWRAQALPVPQSGESDTPPAEPKPDDTDDPPLESPDNNTDQQSSDDSGHASDSTPPSDEVIQVPLPAQLLASLQSAGSIATKRPGKSGRVGQARQSSHHGRCIGTQRFQPGRGHKVHLLATLQAAAPWQAYRHKRKPGVPARPIIKPHDIRAGRFKQATQTVVIFVVDASGSAAQQRLAEAKGAIELLLNECYVRRDEVALIVFQGAHASLVLPPTRSLVTARRQLTQLPAGGGTPLASAIDLAAQLAADVRREGNTPLVCLLTDGRANVDRSGIGGRARAMDQAMQAAKALAETATRTLLIDIARRSSAGCRELATALGSDYIALPRATAGSINQAVSDVMPRHPERVSAA